MGVCVNARTLTLAIAVTFTAAMLVPRQPGGVRTRELIQASMTAAVEKACMELRAHRGQGIVLVCGSLHAVGAALQQLPLRPLLP